MPAKSTRGKMTLVRQICELIPGHLVPKLKSKYNIDARKFSAWSHTTALIYGTVRVRPVFYILADFFVTSLRFEGRFTPRSSATSSTTALPPSHR